MRRIVVTLRGGNRYQLLVHAEHSDSERLFEELAAGRSQALRGWVMVEQPGSGDRIAVHGDEIVELRLMEDDTTA